MVWWRENESSVGLTGPTRVQGRMEDNKFCPKQNLEDTQEPRGSINLNPES